MAGASKALHAQRNAPYLVLTVAAVGPQVAKGIIWKAVASVEAIYTTHAGRPLPEQFGHDYPMGKILLGLHKEDYAGAALVAALLLFDLLRLYVTKSVLELKGNQEQTCTTPFKAEYLHLCRLHLIVAALWLVAISSLLYHLFAFLFSTVWVPDVMLRHNF